jgi:arginase
MSDPTTRELPGKHRPIDLIGAPTDIGASDRGSSMGPEALRVAGIAEALERLGYDVTDRGNLSGPTNPNRGPVNGYRHLDENVAWCEAVRDVVRSSLDKGRFPVLMGGDHSLAIGSAAGVAAHCAAAGKTLSMLWLDAHADFNTAETSPTGNIHGMPVAVVAGDGPERLTRLGPAVPTLDPSRIIQVGIRSVDAQEKTLVVASGMKVFDMRSIDENGMRETMNTALEKLSALGGHVHVSFDADFLDPLIAPGVSTDVPGGPTYREAQLCMEMIYDSGLMGSLDLMELNPAHDIGNKTAELLVDLVESLFGEQILARHDGQRLRHFRGDDQ